MTSSAQIARTNGDRIQPVIDATRASLRQAASWAREHPDEAIAAAAPLLLLTAATRRHDLSYAEALIVAEAGYWLGVAAVSQYRQWKSRPAGPVLKRVI